MTTMAGSRTLSFMMHLVHRCQGRCAVTQDRPYLSYPPRRTSLAASLENGQLRRTAPTSPTLQMIEPRLAPLTRGPEVVANHQRRRSALACRGSQLVRGVFADIARRKDAFHAGL